MEITLKNGDCLELMKGLPDSSVDLARILSEENLVKAMTDEHSQNEVFKGLEKLRKIIFSEPTEDRG